MKSNKEIKELHRVADAHFSAKRYVEAKLSYETAIKHAAFESLDSSVRSILWYNLGATCTELTNSKIDLEDKISNLSKAARCYRNYLKLKNDPEGVTQFALIKIYLVRAWCYIDNDLQQVTKGVNLARECLATLSVTPKNKSTYTTRLSEIDDLDRHLCSALADKSYDQFEYKKAITLYLEAVKLLEKITLKLPDNQRDDNLHILADIYNNLAECYAYCNDQGSALHYFTIALSIYSTLNKKQSEDEKNYADDISQVESILLDLEEYVASRVREEEQRLATLTTDNEQGIRKRKHKHLLIVDDCEQTELDSIGTTLPASDMQKDPSVRQQIPSENRHGDTQFFKKRPPDLPMPITPLSEERLTSMSLVQLHEYLTKLKEVFEIKSRHLAALDTGAKMDYC